jgi:hypothetical protein
MLTKFFCVVPSLPSSEPVLFFAPPLQVQASLQHSCLLLCPVQLQLQHVLFHVLSSCLSSVRPNEHYAFGKPDMHNLSQTTFTSALDVLHHQHAG